MTTATKEMNVELNVQCALCGKVHTIKVNREDYNEYKSRNRRHIQVIFPYLSPAERELLMTQTCEKCWDEMFNLDDED